VTLTSNGLAIAGREVPVYSGTVHYWRLERDRWEAIFDQIQALGFQMIETYIPWSIHETAPGVYDWGTTDPRKDVEAFMRLCEARGIWLLVRPGPLINAELTDFGFPEWVLLDPAVQAHTAVGSLHLDAAWGLHPPRPFPVPSYASEAFYTYVGGWYDAVCPIIARHLAPAGCVAAVQSDNETCYLFHDQTYATDYSPDSLALYRARLAARYQTIAALNAAYGTGYSSFAQVEPPRDCTVTGRADLPWHLDWVAYKEYQITAAVVRCAAMLRDRGLTSVPIFHDVAYQQRTPLDIVAMEATPEVDWVGINLYRNKEDYWSAVQQIRYQVGSTRLPFVPEFGCGIWSHHPVTSTPDEEELITLGTLMHGLKAFNLYMLVERERWQGSPITRHGALRPGYADFYAQLTAFLGRYELWRYERARQVLVLRNYDLGRYSAMMGTLHYAHADLLDLPRALFTADVELDLRWDAEAEADEHRCDTWFGTLQTTLQAESCDYDLADTHIAAEVLAQYPLIFLQATDFMDLNDQQRIVGAIMAGATVVVGPGLPGSDPTLQRPGVLNRYLAAPGEVALGQGRLIWATVDELPALAARLVPPPEFRCGDPACDLTVLRRETAQLLYLANPTPEPRVAPLRFDGPRTLRAAWGPEAVLQGDGALEIPLPPYSARIWEVHRD
jgi:beta-galactosidase